MRSPGREALGAPLAACAAVLLLLGGVAALTWEDGPSGAAAAPARTPVGVVAQRVERLRGLEFTRAPVPQVVDAAEARRDGLADLDREHPPRRRRADETLLALLGLVEPGTDLREAIETVLGTLVAGYYDPGSGRLRIVDGTGDGSRVMDEITLAHELTHALEDQALELRTDALSGSDDAALAYLALVEGSATAVMLEYAGRHFSADQALAGLLPSLFSGDAGAGSLPPFLVAQLAFPYTEGQAFVSALHRRAGGRWTLVDLAHRARRPASTEQVLHPEKWIGVEQPQRVAFDARAALGRGWRRTARGVLGEWTTAELLRLAGAGRPRAAAAGWGGDRYELWRAGAGRCDTPCSDSAALLVRWRWDTRRDRREFSRLLERYVTEGLDAAPAGPERWRARGAGVALDEAAAGVSLAFAPSPALAARLATAPEDEVGESR